jgi:hypothetical protein
MIYWYSSLGISDGAPLQSERNFFSWKGTTFIYVLSSDWWISGLTPLWPSLSSTRMIW